MTLTIVVGPPCAGKSTYTWDERADDDLVVDYDRIATSLGSTTPHNVTGTLADAAHRARFAAINAALESDESSWIIETSPSADRVQQYEDAGATFVLLDPGEQVCIDRAADDDRPDTTEQVIRDWYADPPELPESTKRITEDTTYTRPRAALGRRGDTVSKRTPLGLPTDTAPRAWYRIEDARTQPNPHPTNEDDATETVADIYVYDAIGGWFGVEASTFVADLSALDVDKINLYVNSPGGDVYDAIAMRNALTRHRATVVATVDGMAASAASFLITAADEVVMGANSELMIHDASVIAWGNAGDLRDTAERLDKVSDNIASMYAARAGGDTAAWRVLMLAETWYSAQEAVDEGLADRVAGADDSSGDTTDRANLFDLSAFAHPSRAEAPEPVRAAALARLRQDLPPAAYQERVAALVAEQRAPRPAEPGTPSTTDKKKEVDPMADIITRFRDRLGIPADSVLTEDQLVDALNEALDEQAEPTTTNSTTVAPEGTTLIDSEVLASLQRDARDGATARKEQNTLRRTGIVDAAVREGKVAPARRDHWVAQLEADEEGATATLSTLAAGTVPLEVKAVADDTEATSDKDRLWNKFRAPVETPKES